MIEELAPASDHPDDETLLAYAAGRLPVGDWAAVESHLTSCGVCARHIADLPVIEDDLVARIRSAKHATRDDTSVDRPTDDTDKVLRKPRSSAAIPPQVGRYQIRQLLGKGGFGRVYLGWDPDLDRRVAIKVPQVGRFATADDLGHFIREARMAARLKHPTLVVVYDVQRDGDGVYIVQEYVEGHDLAEWASRASPSIERIVQVTIEIAEAVGFAHQQNVFHRDLKPANILIDQQGHAHVADFGLALHESMLDDGKGQVCGTPAYMSPEQVRGETHRLDGRTDIWSIGVVLYELLTQRQPFAGKLCEDLFDEVKHREPRPPRQINPEIPAELQRICLKCLAKQQSCRYSSAAELVEDLRKALEDQTDPHTPVVMSGVTKPVDNVRVVPKGLRCFDEHDADFFLELLPGPRDRQGLPDSLRFWKTRIEEREADKTFSVGLIYGPSGCGKSSLVRAGLVPRLADCVLPIYLEATPEDTEARLLGAVKKLFPQFSDKASLPELLQGLRDRGLGAGPKLLIVLDQFEQWLQAAGSQHSSNQLVDALRHCDGRNVQCIVLARDDFSMPCYRFFHELDVELRQTDNFAIVDKFDLTHAEKVLRRFGVAYEALPTEGHHCSPEQDAFVEQALAELADANKRVICVHLALFSDMVKGKPWIPSTFQEVGGAEGVGIAFLEETLSVQKANPRHRRHERAARAVLTALLPDSGVDIKGHMQSSEELREAAGYTSRPRDFDELMQVLDTELRLVTPTDPHALADHAAHSHGDSGQMFYQLTHDYLVRPVRQWLIRKQQETRRGRAQLRLAAGTALWNSKPENRYLLSAWEWFSIRLLTDNKRWTHSERKLMAKSGRILTLRWGAALVVAIAIGISLQRFIAAERFRNDRRRAESLVDAVLAAPPEGLPYAIELLHPLREHALAILQDRIDDAQTPRSHRLHAACGLASLGHVDPEYLISHVPEAASEECGNIAAALQQVPSRSLAFVLDEVVAADRERDWRLKARLSILALHLGNYRLAADMLRVKDRPDPIQRTIFIDTFTEWHGKLFQVAQTVKSSQDASVRSGMSLAVGSIQEDDAEVKQAWREILTDWYLAADTGTHSAAGWALRAWGETVPDVAPSVKPTAGRQWHVNSVGLTMLRISPAPGGQRGEQVIDAFLLSDREVSVGLFQQFIDDSDYRGEKPHRWPGPNREASPTPAHPVQQTSWYEAVMFCNWLSHREGLGPCYIPGEKETVEGEEHFIWQLREESAGYRLPTQAQWEHACRAVTRTLYSFGDDEKFLDAYSVYGRSHAEPAGSKLCNALGLFDMHGNVWEWCQDRKTQDAYGSDVGLYRVLRGGAWYDRAMYCQSAHPVAYVPTSRSTGVGFRVALVPD